MPSHLSQVSQSRRYARASIAGPRNLVQVDDLRLGRLVRLPERPSCGLLADTGAATPPNRTVGGEGSLFNLFYSFLFRYAASMAVMNPFRPTFGSAPYVLIGRDEHVLDFEAAFEAVDPGAPGLTALITGARGMGKTVLLGEFAHAAEKQGWVTIKETARPGLLERLGVDRLPRLLEQYAPHKRRMKQLGVNTPLGGFNGAFEEAARAELTVRSQIEMLTDALVRHQTGLAITIDEVQQGDPDELQALGEIAQFARQDDRLFALAAAGLSNYMDDFLAGKGTTFLRRAEPHKIGAIADLDAISDALTQTVEEAGGMIEACAAQYAAKESRGYPFLIQLIGYQAWRETSNITLGAVQVAVENARRRLASQVHSSALVGLSDIDKTYLLAMSLDGEAPSNTGEIASRIGVSPQYANTYRKRLMDQGVIENVGYGQVAYTIPYLGDYLREHASHEAMKAVTSE